MSDVEVRVRKDRGAVAVFTAPWQLVANGENENCPVLVPEELSAEVSAGAVRLTLSEHQIRVMAAYHEAGHGAIYRIIGVPVERIELSGHGASGRTRYPAGQESQYLPYWIAGGLAGGVAAELHLERECLATAHNLFLAHLQCAVDHRRLFELQAPMRLAFYYGLSEPVPWNTETAHIAIDPMRAAARRLLDEAWPAVTALAEHLLAHGHADLTALAALPFTATSIDEVHSILDTGMATTSPWARRAAGS